jgi:hypothetical protein
MPNRALRSRAPFSINAAKARCARRNAKATWLSIAGGSAGIGRAFMRGGGALPCEAATDGSSNRQGGMAGLPSKTWAKRSDAATDPGGAAMRWSAAGMLSTAPPGQGGGYT